MKCARPNCPNLATKNGYRKGLCQKHYASDPLTGFVDGDPIRKRLELIHQQGCAWRDIAERIGLSTNGVRLIIKGGQVQAATASAVMSLHIPARFEGEGIVDATGTHRRIRALQALGWTQRAMCVDLGWRHRRLSAVFVRPRITTANARAISEMYERLAGTPGPCERTRMIAARKGWLPPLAWDDIDNPDEQPAIGDSEAATFADLYTEMRDHLGLSDEEIAKRQGIKKQSLEMKLRRYGLTDRRTA